MANLIDWDNIYLHMHDNDVRYKRRLHRKQLYIDCCPNINIVSSSTDGSSKKLKTVKDQKFMGNDEHINVSDAKPIRATFGTKRNVVDPDVKMFLEGLTEGVVRKECRRKLKGDNGENDLGKQKEDTAKSLRKNKKKEKGEKVVLRGDVDFVSTKEKRNVMFQREGVCGKNYRPSKIIKNERPLNLDDRRDMEYLRKLKRIKYKKVERSPCLTRIDKVSSNMLNSAGKAKRHVAVLSRVSAKCQRTRPRNERKDPVVEQDEDIENSKFISGTGKLNAMVKVENFDDSTNVVLVKKRRQVIQGRDIAFSPNLRERNKREKKIGKYAKVKEENANSLNHNEEDNEHSSDLEILEMDNQQNSSIFEVTKVFNASVIEDNPFSMESPSDYAPEFREKLMDILKRPYNQEEYKSLMQKAEYRHLKGGPEYSNGLKGEKVSDTHGKSLLDYHPDVRRRLRQRNLSKRLNILRGFIYWSEKTCQDGAFQPWLDKSCSAVAPSPH